MIQAVEDVDLFIEKRGRIYGIVSYSGAGKEYVGPSDESVTKPTEGKVIINQTDLGKSFRQKS